MNIFNLKSPEGVVSYKIVGRVVDGRTKAPLNYVNVALENSDGKVLSFSLTTEEGLYELNFEINSEDLKSGKEDIKINYRHTKSESGKRYKEATYIPLTSEREVKEEIPPIELVTLLEDKIDELKADISKVPKDVWDKIKKGYKFESQWIKTYFEEQTQNIFTGLIPTVAKMLINFGINSVNGKKRQCPPPDELLKIIKKRNNLVKALNNIYRGLDVILKAGNVGLTLIKLFKSVQKIQINLPTPIIEYTPHSLIHIKQENIKKIQKEIERYEGLNENIIIYVTILKEIILLLLSYLNTLDNSIKDCFLEQNMDINNPLGFESYLDPLLEELNEIKRPKNSDYDYKTFHNGFEIKVINVDNSMVGGLNRRQAVGLNSQGVISIRGEQSFSSSDEILMNQLIFYININNLKAD